MFIEQAKSNKIGRNELCFCGSNKKYKKCCINAQNLEGNTKVLIKKAQNSIASRLSKINPERKFVSSESIGSIKMSEVIIDFADELLDRASNFKQYERALIIAIVAWNLSMLGNDKRVEAINDLLDRLMIDKDSTEAKDMLDILNWHIEKKESLYPDINRLIMDYEIIRVDKDDFHLNVASTLY